MRQEDPTTLSVDDTTPADLEPCDCDAGTIWLTEQGLVDEITANDGTGEIISFSFGFNGPSRTWRACTKCPAGARKREAGQP